MYDGSGFSGTETALLEIAAYLANHGHDVIITGTNPEPHISNDIQFIPYTYLIESDIFSTIDIYCPIYNLNNRHEHILSKLNPSKTTVWLWLHCFISDQSILDIKTKGYKVIGSYVSEFVKSKYPDNIFDYSCVMENGINDELIVSNNKNRGYWIFDAVYERGCAVAQKVFDIVKQKRPEAAKKLNIASYFKNEISNNNRAYIINHNSLSKKELFALLSVCEYFVYPLVLPHGGVHHDTYASVILEALAMGVIVVTWNVACIPYVYKDLVVAIEPKGHGYDKSARFSRNPWKNSDEAINLLADKVIEIDSNIELKNKLIMNGKEWAKQQTWNKRGELCESWLNSVLNSIRTNNNGDTLEKK
jgi:hypothetical protein